MKIYIETLTKEERMQIKAKFLEAGGTTIYYKARRLNIASMIGFFLIMIVTGADIYLKTGWINYLLDGFLFVFCSYFIFRTYNFKLIELNNFALKEKKTTKQKNPQIKTKK